MRNISFAAMVFIAAQIAASYGMSAVVSPSDKVADGRRIYQRRCASCHGVNGQGAPRWKHRDGLGEYPAPPQNAQGHTWRHSDAMLVQMISHGLRDPFNKTQRLTMPAFGRALSPQQIQNVIAYFKTLWTPAERRFQSEQTGGPPNAQSTTSSPSGKETK